MKNCGGGLGCDQVCNENCIHLEGFTTGTPCTSQGNFNEALRAGIKYNYKQNQKKAKPWIWVYLALYVIFFVWAILLAVQVPAGQMRTVHVALAIVFSPVYVLAYYLGMLKN
jgi:bacteriorhodopsin